MGELKIKQRGNTANIKPIQKRFHIDYEFVVGSDKTKSFIKKIGKKRGRDQVFDDPNFDIID